MISRNTYDGSNRFGYTVTEDDGPSSYQISGVVRGSYIGITECVSGSVIAEILLDPNYLDEFIMSLLVVQKELGERQ